MSTTHARQEPSDSPTGAEGVVPVEATNGLKRLAARYRAADAAGCLSSVLLAAGGAVYARLGLQWPWLAAIGVPLVVCVILTEGVLRYFGSKRRHALKRLAARCGVEFHELYGVAKASLSGSQRDEILSFCCGKEILRKMRFRDLTKNDASLCSS